MSKIYESFDEWEKDNIDSINPCNELDELERCWKARQPEINKLNSTIQEQSLVMGAYKLQFKSQMEANEAYRKELLSEKEKVKKLKEVLSDSRERLQFYQDGLKHLDNDIVWDIHPTSPFHERLKQDKEFLNLIRQTLNEIGGV